jgi:D-alanyl-D-alanine carboxypeptidase (penicillin-binding protein 5/6)
VAASDASLVTWGATPISATTDATALHLGIEGSDVGSVTFTAGQQTVTVPLVLDRTIDDPGPWWRLGNPFALL